VTEGGASPAQFRLAAFVHDWATPLRWALRLHRAFEEHQPHRDSSQVLFQALLVEAQLWVELGQEVGYFAGSEESRAGGWLDPSVRDARGWFAGLFRQEGDAPSELTVAEFGVALAEAREDLTPERSEFLALFYFSDDAEWEQRLDEVVDFARTFRQRPGLSLPGEEVDRIAWSLEGPESGIVPRPGAFLPADWRGQSPRAFDPDGSGAPQRDRFDALMEVRERISVAARCAAEDATAAQLRLLAEHSDY
jgi:hypothetical protein